jgi:DNA-binding response OmpR family regulator
MGTRLLSVDDDEQILKIIQVIAEDLGFDFEALSESHRFMTTYTRVKPDIVTLDLMMPMMDGIEIIRWLNDIEAKVSVIIVSGGPRIFLNLSEKLAAARGALRATLLPKPFEIRAFRDLLVNESYFSQ